MTLLVTDSWDLDFQKVNARYNTSANGTDMSHNRTGGVYGGGGLFVPTYNNSAYARWVKYRLYATAQTGTPRTIRMAYWIKADPDFINRTSFNNVGHIIFHGESSPIGSGLPGAEITVDAGSGGYYPQMKFGYWSTSYYNNGGNYTTTNMARTHPLTFLDGKWHYVEIAVKYSLTAGQFIFRMDGVEYLNIQSYTALSGLTSPAYAAPQYVTFCNINFNGNFLNSYIIDDLLIWDSVDSGDGFVDSFLPPQRIYTLRPSADTAQAQSTPSTGATRYNLLSTIDGNTQNGVITLGPYQKDEYVMSNTIANTNVRAVLINMTFASNTVASYANLKLTVNSAGVYSNSNVYSTAVQSYLMTVFQDSNNRSAVIALRDFGAANIAWAQTSVDSIQVGIENIG